MANGRVVGLVSPGGGEASTLLSDHFSQTQQSAGATAGAKRASL